MTGQRSRIPALACCAAATAAAIATCAASPSTSLAAASGGASKQPRTASRSSAGVRLGSPHAAKGAPVVLGMINVEGSPAGSYPEESEAAQAFVRYVNEYRDGIHGHPIKLDLCVTNGTPSVSAQCANQIVGDHPVAIAGATDFATAASFPIFDRAHLAYIGGTPIDAPEETDPRAVEFVGFAVGAFAGLADFAATGVKAKSVAIIYPQVPVGLRIASSVVTPVLKAEGVKTVVKTPVSPSATDFTPAVAAANTKHPKAIIAAGSAASCAPLMTARQSLGVTAALLLPGQCAAEQILQAAGSAANGVYMNNDFDLPNDLSDPDVRLFRTVLAKYAPSGIALDEFAQAGANTIMNIWSAFNAIPKHKLGTRSILRYFHSGSDHPNFMAHPYTCDGRVVPGAPTICNAAQRILVIKNDEPEPYNDRWYTVQKDLKP
jgi:branched-chain amino acid transport system substrate-binding protein